MANQTITKKLRSLLKNDPDSINAIAKAAGLPQSVLFRFYVGERDLKLATVEKLFRYYNLSVTEKKRS